MVKSFIAPSSKIALDQKYEQNNKTIKLESEYINMVNMEDKEYLRKLEICFPEIHAFLENNDHEGILFKITQRAEPFFLY